MLSLCFNCREPLQNFAAVEVRFRERESSLYLGLRSSKP